MTTNGSDLQIQAQNILDAIAFTILSDWLCSFFLSELISVKLKDVVVDYLN
ncbi:MAG: hypothetical protein F6K28_37455 [Microcoleus sp. SIO2G3]|nr:hypothetical protein [Microcoleus sp. SIO2G3]